MYSEIYSSDESLKHRPCVHRIANRAIKFKPTEASKVAYINSLEGHTHGFRLGPRNAARDTRTAPWACEKAYDMKISQHRQWTTERPFSSQRSQWWCRGVEPWGALFSWDCSGAPPRWLSTAESPPCCFKPHLHYKPGHLRQNYLCVCVKLPGIVGCC